MYFIIKFISFFDFYLVNSFEIEKAIEFVMEEGEVSRKEAVEVLLKHNGDPYEALVDLLIN